MRLCIGIYTKGTQNMDKNKKNIIKAFSEKKHCTS